MNATAPLGDADLRLWRQCPRQFWQRRHDSAASDATHQASSALVNQGLSDAPAGDVVRGPSPSRALLNSWPGALLIEAPQDAAAWDAALQRTRAALSGRPRVILGACLACSDESGDWRVQVDVLEPVAGGLKLWRVRHATVAADIDVEITMLWSHVARQCGLPLVAASLALVDTDFIYPGFDCYAGLFRELDLNPALLVRPVEPMLSALRATLCGSEPEAGGGAQCAQATCAGRCGSASAGHDAGDGASESTDEAVASLDIVGRELAAELRAEGLSDLHDVPEARLTDPRHRRAWRAVRQGAPVLEPAAARALDDLPQPWRVLRFETVGFAVPIWPGTRPYQVLPFQWSCARLDEPRRWLFRGFLASAQGGDPRRAFAESLIAGLGTQGAILVYNAGFERNRLRELATAFDDLAPALDALRERIVDLFQIARANFYHPAMAGSWSAKRVFAALAGDVPAIDFAALHAASPLDAYARSLRADLEAVQVQTLREALSLHGRYQTAALIRLTEVLAGQRAP